MVLKADLNVTLRAMVPVGNEVEEDRLETFADRPEKHSVTVSRLLRPWGCLSIEELKATELLEPGRVPFAEGEFEQVGDAEALMLSTVLIVILILILLGALPTWGYSSGWGYGPGGIVGTILVIVVILALLGRI